VTEAADIVGTDALWMSEPIGVIDNSRTLRKINVDAVEGGSTPAVCRRRRMLAVDREELILVEATRYFAEHGLSAGTIELARRIGITQPLLYRYFPTKEALLKKVYERLFPQNWDPTIVALLDDRRIPLRDRLKSFYRRFAEQVLTYEHVRLFLFSGLTNSSFNAEYYTVVTERIFTRVVAALRSECFGKKTKRAITPEEMELVQSLHGAIYHVAYRRWLHGPSLGYDLGALIGRKVDFYLDGALQTMTTLKPKEPVRRARR
jgi:AcrR family transcriptional regulator